MNQATDVGREIAEALRAEWRMIASVSLRPRPAGDGFEAALMLDPIVVKGALEQQGYPQNPEALANIERRRQAALEDCMRRVNESLPARERIKAFTVVG